MEDSKYETIPFIDDKENSVPINQMEIELLGPPEPVFNVQVIQNSPPQSNSDSFLAPPNSETVNDDVEKASTPLLPLPQSSPLTPGIPGILSPPNINGNGDHNIMPIGQPERRTSSFKFPLHSAAEKGKVKKLEDMVAIQDAYQTDFKNRTPLHYACAFPYQKKAVKMVDILLGCPMDSDRKMDFINHQDKQGESGLHLAASIGHRELVEKLIFAAADVNLKDNKGVEPLHIIYSKVPAAMIPVFDEAIECKVGDPNDQHLILQLDFGAIVGYPDLSKNPGMYELETKLLSYCLQQSEQKRSAIMLHPIVQTFLFLKWKKIRILLWISILYHMIWLLLYTLFITDLYLMQCPYRLPPTSSSDAEMPEANAVILPLNNSMNGSDAELDVLDMELNATFTLDINNETEVDGVECPLGKDLLSSVNIKLGFLIYVSVSVALKELYEMYSTPQLKFYFYQMENIGQWALISVVALTSLPVFMTDGDNTIFLKSWQYQAAALGIFLAWSLILSQIGKIPRFAIFIEILGKVLKSFTMFMLTFASLLVAFMVSFQILMPEKAEFNNFPWGFIKVVVMMTGEINYDDVFFDDDADDIPFPTSTKLLYAAFVAVVTIILFNLLIGLTVSDIQGLSNVAQLSNLSSQLEQIYLMEKFIISKKLQRWLVRFKKNHWLRYFLVTQQTDGPENMGLAIHISKIPKDIQFQVREKAMPNFAQEKDDDDEGKSQLSDQNAVGMSEERLREVIKDVLKELLVELEISKSKPKMAED